MSTYLSLGILLDTESFRDAGVSVHQSGITGRAITSVDLGVGVRLQASDMSAEEFARALSGLARRVTDATEAFITTGRDVQA